MKKLLLNLFLFLGITTSAQDVFKDAIFLRSMSEYEGEDFSIKLTKEVIITLSQYDLDTSTIKRKPFFDSLYITFTGSSQAATIDSKKLLSTFISSAGSLDVTNFALGLTDFLIKRAKTELNTAFFKRLNDALKDTPVLNTMFPNTIKILDVIGTDIYQYDLYLNNLRSSFEKDIQALPENLHKIARDRRVDGTLLLTLDFLNQVKENKHPSELIKFLKDNSYVKAVNPDLHQTFQVVDFLSESLRTTEVDRYWASREELNQLNDPTTLRIYLGLLYQKLQKPEHKTSNERIGNALKALASNINQAATITQFIYRFSEATDLIENTIASYKKQRKEILENIHLDKKERNKLLFEASFDIYTATLHFIENVYTIELLNIRIDPSQMNAAKEIVGQLRDVGQIGIYLNNKQYAGAISQAAFVLNRIAPDNNETIRKFIKYGAFMAALIEAENPEEVKGAIEAAALPPGSYSIKRHSRFNVSLNGYIGGFYGHESIHGVNDKLAFNNLSISAPVGIYFGWGLCKTAKAPWSLGFFIPVIDLGTVASFRLGNSEAESVPTIQLHHLIAPGLFIETGIGSTPLSFGAGAQIGSRLRSVEPTINEVGDFYWRYGVTLKVDIPILNLYSSPKKI